MEAQVLVVAQDAGTRESLSSELQREGFRIVCTAGIEEGLALARTRWPDLIILDLVLDLVGSEAGPDLLNQLPSDVRAPILVLGYRDDELKLRALELGASVYLSKPVGVRELVARMRALLRPVARRESNSLSSAGVIVGDLNIDVPSRRVWRNGTLLRLRPKEFDLLLLLMRAPGRVWTREEILGPVWGESFAGDSRTVDVHIRWLREKIEPDPSAPQVLETVRGVGYRCADPSAGTAFGPMDVAVPSSPSVSSTLVPGGRSAMRFQRSEDSTVFDDPKREPTRNRAELLGFVGQKPELRYSQRGEAVISWSLATHHWHRQDSRPIRTTDWHNIVAYGEMAEPCSVLRPGQLVRAVGWLHTRSWKDRLGTPRERTEIVLTEVAVVQHPPPHQLSLGLSRDADLPWHEAQLVA